MFFWFLTLPETFTLLAILLAFVAAFAYVPLFTVDGPAIRRFWIFSVWFAGTWAVVFGVVAVGLWFRWWWF